MFRRISTRPFPGEKVLVVKSAEAEAESKYLSGVAIYCQATLDERRAEELSQRSPRKAWRMFPGASTGGLIHPHNKRYLSGVGVARQRKAIVDGLRGSISEFSGNIKGTSPKDVVDLLLITQYFDMLKDIGARPACNTVYIPDLD